MKPGEHSQPVVETAVIQTVLGKRAVKDLDPSLELSKSTLDVVCAWSFQEEHRPLVPRPSIDHRSLGHLPYT